MSEDDTEKITTEWLENVIGWVNGPELQDEEESSI